MLANMFRLESAQEVARMRFEGKTLMEICAGLGEKVSLLLSFWYALFWFACIFLLGFTHPGLPTQAVGCSSG